MSTEWDNEDAERSEACDGAMGVCVTPPTACPSCRWGELATYDPEAGDDSWTDADGGEE